MDLKETEEILKSEGKRISKKFPGMGFLLIMFEFSSPGVANYISNGRREDMVEALREAANRLEKSQDIPVIEGNA